MDLTFEKLRDANARRGAQWDGKPPALDDLSFRAMELGGETGEALNVAKKLVRHLTGRVGGMELGDARNALAEELADVVICADRIAELLNIDLGIAVVEKFNKTSRKHGLPELVPTPAEADNDALRSALMRVTGSLGLILKGARISGPAHKDNYDHATAVLDRTC